MKRIAVTGGIAVGKSSLCDILFRFGHPIISADNHTKKALSHNSSIYPHILKLFKLSDNKTLDSQMITQQIFSDSHLKQQFEKIIHPWIFQSILKEEEDLKKKEHQIIFYEIPLLFEANLESFFDFIILVTCQKNIQKTRLMQRMSLSESQAQQRIDSQMGQEEKITKSHLVIENNSSIDQLKKSAQSIIKKFPLQTTSHA